MNNGRGPGAPANDNSALSLLVNAVDSRDGGRRDSGGGSNQGRSLAETLRLQGMSGHGGDTGPSLEEQLLMYQQQQQQQAQQQQHHAYGGHQGQGGGLFSQIRDQRNMFSQLGQQQQLANLLGLGQGGGGGGGGGGGANPNDMRAALAAQLRQSQQSQSQAPQFTQADLLALSRSGALQGILGGQGGGGHGGGGGGQGANQYASEIEGMQRLEELERRQRLLAASKNAAGRPMEAEMSYRPEPAPEARMPRPPDKQQQQQYPPRPSAAPVAAAEPAAAPMAESNKEEVEKAPGSVIVPCRARGMPMDHNFKTAYFVIPENVKHGEELICSYFACRNAGIKFRYCSHCKVPVAKRNFRKRHKHGGEDIPKGTGDESGDEVELAVKKGIPSQITANREASHDADGISSQSADSTKEEKNMTETDVQQGLVRSSMRTFEIKQSKDTTLKDIPAAAAPLGDDKISEKRQKRWTSLLARRPSTKDGDSMSAWLMEVLAVSDLATPLKVTPDNSATISQETHQAAGKKKGDTRSPGKKKGDAPDSDSPRSDIGYGSSNDESDGNDKKQRAGKKSSSDQFIGGGVVKKKRPADREAGHEGSPSEPYASGSFAEWKERKKQKKAMKGGDTSKEP